MYPALPQLAVRDSFDDDDLSDVDDEVFIRDGRNGGLKLDDEGGVKRPLMAPRRKCKTSRVSERHGFPRKALLAPFCYGLFALLVLLGLIILVIFAVSIFPMPLTVLKNWLSHEMENNVNNADVIPCTSLATNIAWTRTLPKLMSEAPLRSNDVNGDKIEDIIVGFSTELDPMDTSEYFCTLYFENQTPCLGGVLALDGRSGETIWIHWTADAIFSIDCGLDLTNDKVKDCVISGRGGILHAINGHNGSSIWELQDLSAPNQQRILDVYDAKYIPDADGDEVGDIIASHTLQTDGIRISKILMVSGKSGNIIHNVSLPETEQIFLAPQTLVHSDGETIFIVATGSQRQSGGLYIVPLPNFMRGDLKLRQLHHETGKGILSSPILVDITSDGTEDIITALCNSTIVAYDGLSFRQIWNYTVPNSEVISIPIPGYYNDDDVPDFMVKHQIGPGFPTYYYTVATILDGKTGKSLLEKPIEDSLSGQMSGLSVTVDGFGNDWFLHWSADCLYHEGVKNEYQFFKNESITSQTLADLCKLRFNSTLITKLLALSQHVGPPGLSLYFSEDWKKLEFNNSVDPRKEADKYSESHSPYDSVNSDRDVQLVSERSPRFHKSYHKASNFRHKGNNNVYAEQKNYYLNDKDPEESIRNDLDTEVPNYFDSKENLKDPRKWEEDMVELDKNYGVSYDGGDGHAIEISQMNGIREQRSDTSDTRTVNNDTNEFKNQLDPSMDYTNGQSRDNRYYPFEPINRTNSVKESSDYSSLSDFDFEDVQADDKKVSGSKEKRKTKERNESVEAAGQKEIIIKDARSNRRHESFIEIDRRPKAQGVMLRSNGKSDTAENVNHGTKDTENSDYKDKQQINTRNIQLNDNIEIHPISEIYLNNISNNANVYKQKVRRINIRDVSNKSTGKIVKPLEEVGGKWLLKTIFAKVMQNDEDARIEKIFKRESMKNEGKKKIDKQKLNKVRSKKVKRQVQNGKDQSDVIGGVQRQPPTGILLPSLVTTPGKSSVDLIFSTFWLPASEASIILLQQDLECINRKKAKLGSKIQQEQSDQIVSQCLTDRNVNYKVYQEATDRENTKIALGQMTVYRMKLECVCPEDMLPDQTCKNISLRQSWPAHLGASANGYFKPLQRPST